MGGFPQRRMGVLFCNSKAAASSEVAVGVVQRLQPSWGHTCESPLTARLEITRGSGCDVQPRPPRPAEEDDLGARTKFFGDETGGNNGGYFPADPIWCRRTFKWKSVEVSDPVSGRDCELDRKFGTEMSLVKPETSPCAQPKPVLVKPETSPWR